MNALRLASAIVAAVGFLTLMVGALMLRNRLEAIRKWQPVEAEVTRAWMEEHRGGSDTGEDSISYSANYELAYAFGGKPIRSAARSNDPLLTSSEVVQARIARHSPGTRGLVYMNPDDPSQVRLNLGPNAVTLGWPLWVLTAGASLLLFAGSFWLMGTPGVEW
jgi:hypothetical protein